MGFTKEEKEQISKFKLDVVTSTSEFVDDITKRLQYKQRDTTLDNISLEICVDDMDIRDILSKTHHFTDEMCVSIINVNDILRVRSIDDKKVESVFINSFVATKLFEESGIRYGIDSEDNSVIRVTLNSHTRRNNKHFVKFKI